LQKKELFSKYMKERIRRGSEWGGRIKVLVEVTDRRTHTLCWWVSIKQSGNIFLLFLSRCVIWSGASIYVQVSWSKQYFVIIIINTCKYNYY